MKRDAEVVSRATLSLGPRARLTTILGSRHRLSRISLLQTSLVAQMVKSLPAMWETQVQSLGWKDLEKGMATHSSFLALRIPCTEDLVGYSPWGHKESDITGQLSFSLDKNITYIRPGPWLWYTYGLFFFSLSFPFLLFLVISIIIYPKYFPRRLC